VQYLAIRNISNTNDNLAERIDLLFRSVHAHLVAIQARQRACAELSMARMRVLWILNQHKATSPGEVARFLGVSGPTATGLVDQLVRAGYVRRERSPLDRRQVILTLRPTAQRVMDAFARRRRERFEKLLKMVDEADARRLIAALETMNEIFAKGTP
jgi:DNA-binding MarR family transcriptional regulator